MIYHNSFRYVVAMLLATWALALMGANVDELIQSFDKKQNVATANAVFQQLDKEQFTDELLAFKPVTNADTLRQQVSVFPTTRTPLFTLRHATSSTGAVATPT